MVLFPLANACNWRGSQLCFFIYRYIVPNRSIVPQTQLYRYGARSTTVLVYRYSTSERCRPLLRHVTNVATETSGVSIQFQAIGLPVFGVQS